MIEINVFRNNSFFPVVFGSSLSFSSAQSFGGLMHCMCERVCGFFSFAPFQFVLHEMSNGATHHLYLITFWAGGKKIRAHIFICASFRCAIFISLTGTIFCVLFFNSINMIFISFFFCWRMSMAFSLWCVQFGGCFGIYTKVNRFLIFPEKSVFSVPLTSRLLSTLW